MQVGLRRTDRSVPEQFLDDVDAAPLASNSVAVECRNMCGVTARSNPARTDRAASHFRTVSVDIGRPTGRWRNVTSTKSHDSAAGTAARSVR